MTAGSEREAVFRLAGRGDNDDLAALLADGAMDSWIRLSLERRPDYFAADRLMGEARTVNPEAYREFLLGQEQVSLRRKASIPRGISHLQQSLAIDSEVDCAGNHEARCGTAEKEAAAQ